jgi:multidrug efflux pump subunit AcrA (membrane-fusion protein)
VIVFDVLPDQSLNGVVTQVDPALVTSWETKTGRVLVQLDDISVLGSRWLPVGLNATVDMIGDSTENAVLIPIEALQELPGGEYGVYVVQEGGQKTLKPVITGLMDATRVEIVSGLEAGESVVLGDPGN